jgi:ATP-binding cassette subfamily C (CFTR/MRP) protein 10
METTSKWDWQEMCGSAGFIVWIPERKDFGFCFQALCIHIPLLVILCALSSFFCAFSSKRIIRGPNQINILRLRCLAVAILAILPIVETCLLIIKSPTTLCYVYYLLRGTQSITWFIHLGYCLSLMSGLTLHTRGPVLIAFVWIMNFLTSIIATRTSILLHVPTNLSSQICFVFSISMTTLHGIYLITLLPSHLDGSEEINEEMQPLLSASVQSSYNRFREEIDPHHLGVAQEDSTLCSNLLFHWVNPLMNKGVAGRLNQAEDLFDLPLEVSTGYISHKMQATLTNTIPEENTELRPITNSSRHHQSPSLFKALHKCFGWQFYGIGILKFIADIAGFFGPMLLHGLVNFIEHKTEAMINGYMYAAGLFASTAIG